MQEAFVEGWRSGMPSMGGEWRLFLEGLAWEKAVYEALYELRHRPDWLWIPLRALETH
jgi:predicted trehalose synthase